MENTDQFEEEDSRRVDWAIELASTSSGDVSAASGGSGEIQAVARRRKCVGRSNRGVAWGFTSMIGRRREMEDAVAVVPGFMAHACDHVGGCTAAGARSSADISPVHFFGVYDGHGGSQVNSIFLIPNNLNCLKCVYLARLFSVQL